MPLAATTDARIDAARATADRKAKDFIDVIPTDYSQDNPGVTLYFSKVMSILSDANPDALNAVTLLNDITCRIHLAPILGNPQYLDIDQQAFKQNVGHNGPPAVHNAFMHPQWNTPGHGWQQLAALIVNLAPILELGTRILIGLTNHQGVVYHEIKHLHPTAFIEALELIATSHFHFSPSSVSNLWADFSGMTFVAGADLPAFWKEVFDLALDLDVQGRSLQVPRSGPDPRQILQAVVQAISQCGSNAYDVDMAHAEDLLNAPAVTKTILHGLRHRMVKNWNNKNPSRSPQKRVIGAIYPADPNDSSKEHCPVCGGSGHSGRVCPSAKLDTGRLDSHQTPPLRWTTWSYRQVSS
jgi:hypothetical protein